MGSKRPRSEGGLNGEDGCRGNPRSAAFCARLAFQRGRAKGLAATYHFTFTGREPAEATIVIRDRTLKVLDGHQGVANLRVIADSDTWLRFLRKEASLPWALLRRRIRLKGSPRLLLAFGRCFPS